MRPAVKYWIFLFAIALAVFAVIFGAFVASWYHLSGEEQEFVRALAVKLLPYPLLGGVCLFMIIGSLVSLLFHNYIIPVLKLGEETKLISVVNPGYRIEPKGAKELVHLAEIINESAEAFQKLRTEVDLQISQAKNQLKEERNRLAALMSELPCGVLVCNTDGQVLLYNAQAQRLLQRSGRLIGIGRSLFGVLDRDAIVHALDILHQATRQGQMAPSTNFMTAVHEDVSLRINMAPVFTERGEMRSITGFVLAIEDMTRQIEADLQGDMLFTTLTEAMRFSTGEIREAISAILGNPGMERTQLDQHRQIIDRASQAMEDQLQHAREEHASLQFSQAKSENVQGEYLIEILTKHLSHRLRMRVDGETAPDLWLRVDSFSLIQGLAQLGEHLKTEGIGSFSILLGKSDHQAHMKLEWPGCRLSQGILMEWQRRPQIADGKKRLISFLDLIGQFGGEVRKLHKEEEGCDCLELVFPLAEPEDRWGGRSTLEHRPIYYEFDLFHQPGWEELGQQQLSRLTFVVFDTETTGLNPSHGDEIIQIGAIRIINGRILYDETLDQLVDPRRSVPAESVAVHGIDPALLHGQPTIEKVLPDFHHFAENSILVAHNAAFDMKFLQLKEEQAGVRFDHPVLDTLLLSWVVHPNLQQHSLEGLAKLFDVPIVGRHTALGDAIVTAEVLIKLIPLLATQGIHTLEEAIMASAASPFAKLKF